MCFVGKVAVFCVCIGLGESLMLLFWCVVATNASELFVLFAAVAISVVLLNFTRTDVAVER